MSGGFCRGCGRQLNDGQTFCPSCGLPVRVAEAQAEPVPAQPAPAPKRSFGRGLAIAAITAAIACAAVGGLWVTGVIGKADVESSDASAEAAKTGAEATAAADPGTGDAGAGATDAATLSAEESYQLLVREYASIGTLGRRIGDKATETGFAYEVFNQRISKADAGLVTACQDLLDEVRRDKKALGDAQLDQAYEPQRTTLLRLYDYLDTRMDAMQQAAVVARDGGTAAQWRKKLQPRSGDAREAFDREYPTGQPTRP